MRKCRFIIEYITKGLFLSVWSVSISAGNLALNTIQSSHRHTFEVQRTSCKRAPERMMTSWNGNFFRVTCHLCKISLVLMKGSPLYRRHIRIDFLVWKWLYCDSNLTEICSHLCFHQGFPLKRIMIHYICFHPLTVWYIIHSRSKINDCYWQKWGSLCQEWVFEASRAQTFQEIGMITIIQCYKECQRTEFYYSGRINAMETYIHSIKSPLKRLHFYVTILNILMDIGGHVSVLKLTQWGRVTHICVDNGLAPTKPFSEPMPHYC